MKLICPFCEGTGEDPGAEQGELSDCPECGGIGEIEDGDEES